MFANPERQLNEMELLCARVTDLMLRARRLEKEGHVPTAEVIRQRAFDLLANVEQPIHRNLAWTGDPGMPGTR